ncbi:MAG TPA: hypothetical protein VLF69_02250 [Candidatus Saccharimonadales bacterium]|nr:hypothetical protein [Candidatus Saccharimonadales bacterium]
MRHPGSLETDLSSAELADTLLEQLADPPEGSRRPRPQNVAHWVARGALRGGDIDRVLAAIAEAASAVPAASEGPPESDGMPLDQDPYVPPSWTPSAATGRIDQAAPKWAPGLVHRFKEDD